MSKKRAIELLLLRHAKSNWKDPSLPDFDRPLNRRGRRAAGQIAAWLAAARCRVDLVLCSSAARTRETCDVLHDTLGNPEILFERALYLASAPRLLKRLRDLPPGTRSVLLIGHNPGLHKLALALSAEAPAEARTRLKAKFPTGALARFALGGGGWRALGPETARLRDFVSPRDLD